MKKTHFSKADPTGDGPVVSESVIFDQLLPDFKTLESARINYSREADVLEQVLFDVMPGGVYDQLLGAMLRRRGSLLRIPHNAWPETEKDREIF
jgi:hypothetical protein